MTFNPETSPNFELLLEEMYNRLASNKSQFRRTAGSLYTIEVLVEIAFTALAVDNQLKYRTLGGELINIISLSTNGDSYKKELFKHLADVKKEKFYEEIRAISYFSPNESTFFMIKDISFMFELLLKDSDDRNIGVFYNKLSAYFDYYDGYMSKNGFPITDDELDNIIVVLKKYLEKYLPLETLTHINKKFIKIFQALGKKEISGEDISSSSRLMKCLFPVPVIEQYIRSLAVNTSEFRSIVRSFFNQTSKGNEFSKEFYDYMLDRGVKEDTMPSNLQIYDPSVGKEFIDKILALDDQKRPLIYPTTAFKFYTPEEIQEKMKKEIPRWNTEAVIDAIASQGIMITDEFIRANPSFFKPADMISSKIWLYITKPTWKVLKERWDQNKQRVSDFESFYAITASYRATSKAITPEYVRYLIGKLNPSEKDVQYYLKKKHLNWILA